MAFQTLRARNTIPKAAHYVSLIVGFFVLLFLDRHLWFIGDVFEFFTRIQPGHSLDLLRPHNEHWSTIPIAVTWVIYKIFGLRTYVPYIGLDIAAHILVVHLLWRWMLRLGSDTWVATGLAGVFVVLGAGVENLTSSFQIGFLFPVAFGLIAAMLVDHSSATAKRDFYSWPLAIAAIMCSAIGVYMVALAGLIALFRRGWLAAVRVVSLPAVVYLAWSTLIARGSLLTTHPHPSQLALIPQYVWTGITTAVDNTTGMAGLGGILIVGLAIWMYRQRGEAHSQLAFAIAAPLIAILFFIGVGVGRVAIGVFESASTRYAYAFDALVFPTVAIMVTQLIRRLRVNGAAFLPVAAVLAVNGLAQMSLWLSDNGPIQVAAKGDILAAAHLLSSGAPLAIGPAGEVEPVRTPDLTVSDLQTMLAAGKIPLSVPVSAGDLLSAQLYMQLSVTSSPLFNGRELPQIDADTIPRPIADGSGCFVIADGSVAPELRLIFRAPSSISITPTGSGHITLALATESDPLTFSQSHDVAVSAHQTVYFNVSASSVEPMLTLPAGANRVCGIGE